MVFLREMWDRNKNTLYKSRGRVENVLTFERQIGGVWNSVPSGILNNVCIEMEYGTACPLEF
jgi:hypothetical protein